MGLQRAFSKNYYSNDEEKEAAALKFIDILFPSFPEYQKSSIPQIARKCKAQGDLSEDSLQRIYEVQNLMYEILSKERYTQGNIYEIELSDKGRERLRKLKHRSEETNQIINPTMKDAVLFYLCSNLQCEQLYPGINTKKLLDDLNMSFDSLNAIMQQFQRWNLISELSLRGNYLTIIVHVEAHDLAQQGGFHAQEEIFKSNLEKLKLEIDNLKKELEPNHLETLNKISSIGSALFGGLSLFK